MTYVLTAEDIAALRSFAIEHGPKWKSELSLDWYHARLSHCRDIPERGSILHSLRNDLGPAWLDSFAFETRIAWPDLRKVSAAELRRLLVATVCTDSLTYYAAKRELRRRCR